jgi:hypothetical protein
MFSVSAPVALLASFVAMFSFLTLLASVKPGEPIGLSGRSCAGSRTNPKSSAFFDRAVTSG